MLTTDLTKVCHGVTVADLLDSPALLPYETHLCQVDWSQVFREVMNNTGLEAIVNFDVSCQITIFLSIKTMIVIDVTSFDAKRLLYCMKLFASVIFRQKGDIIPQRFKM